MRRIMLIVSFATWLLVATGLLATAATNVFTVGNLNPSAYVIDGTNNPNLSLVRGSTYIFNVSTPGHPFWVKAVQGTGTGNAYNDGVTSNGITSGTLTFAVPSNAPSLLYYNCQFHAAMTGQLTVSDPLIVSGPDIVSIDADSSTLDLAWTNGFAPFQVQSRASLLSGSWSNLGPSTVAHSYTQAPPAAPVLFLRVQGSSAPTDMAEYRVTFDSTWSASTHPTNFPTPNEHYSPLIGGTHDATTHFWQPGGTATPGIETMAETGGTGPLTAEVNAAITAGSAEYVLSGGGLGSSPGSVATTFDISRGFPLVTLVTMIAPSPDWFVGVHDLDLFAGGDWLPSLTVALQPYDAGTDDGVSYTSPNADSSPQGVIEEITGFPLEFSGEVAPFGTFIFERIDNP